MIPKTQHLDALFGEKSASFFIPGPLVRKAVSTTIKFNCEFCYRAVKVEEVNAAGILAAEFEFNKAAVTQQTP